MSQNNQPSSLSQAISKYLARTGMKQVDLAEYLNVTERTLRRWKNGEIVVSDVRELNPAMDYIEKAEKAFAQEWSLQRRDVLISTAKAMILVHGGEIRHGVEVARETTELCRQAGNIRLLDRIYGIQKYLDRLSREIGDSGSLLREALDGPVEY